MTAQHLCPICARPLSEDEGAARFRPFCSRRCADIDLGRWLKGAYAIPSAEPEDATESEPLREEREAGEEAEGDGAGARRPRVRH